MDPNTLPTVQLPKLGSRGADERRFLKDMTYCLTAAGYVLSLTSAVKKQLTESSGTRMTHKPVPYYYCL